MAARGRRRRKCLKKNSCYNCQLISGACYSSPPAPAAVADDQEPTTREEEAEAIEDSVSLAFNARPDFLLFKMAPESLSWSPGVPFFTSDGSNDYDERKTVWMMEILADATTS